MRKLERYRVRRIELEWFTSYLSNGKQAVKIGPSQSKFQTVESGVPQKKCTTALIIAYIH